MVRRAQSANGIGGPLTVRVAVEGYLDFLEAHGKSAVDARHRANAHTTQRSRTLRRRH
jgi:hypothetical protein